VAAFVAVSETVRRALVASGADPARVRVVPSGSDVGALGRVAPAADVGAFAAGLPLAGGVGRLSRRKDWTLFVRAASRLRADGVEARFVLAGEGPERRRLEREVRRSGLDRDFAFLGFRADGEAVVRALDVLFFPSTAEGAPGAVREAMLLGVPVVARDAPGTRETLDGHGVLLPGPDPAEAARSLGALLRDPGRRARLAREARESATRRFDAEANVGGTLAVYREVLGTEPPRAARQGG
jgi:glycosyltransferase involved in cell wall biosynthesis